ncbi:METACASPASE-4 [Salix purpurea]|uniref:METACASPASE-4 n=1 Tax=Salix purpurea TaxID=77065 RepID=A0A9Q0VGF9_SALPP|nr:METACASPASE-4 [Salix purpurea]
MLTEEETDPSRRPTKSSMRLALSWLVQGCRPGDSLVFHFSGHGSQQKDYNGDELDGYDETLCPTDFETQGMIVDDEINAVIVKPLPPRGLSFMPSLMLAIAAPCWIYRFSAEWTGAGSMNGKIIALEQEYGKEQVEGK